MGYGLIITWFPINSDAARTLYVGGGGSYTHALPNKFRFKLTSLNLGRTRIYEYTPPPPINVLAVPQ